MKLKIILSTALFILPLSAYEYNPNAKSEKGILKEPGQKSTGPKKSVRFVDGDLHSEQDKDHQQQRRDLSAKKKADPEFRRAADQKKTNRLEEMDDSVDAIEEDKIAQQDASAQTPEAKEKLFSKREKYAKEDKRIAAEYGRGGQRETMTSYNTLKDRLLRKTDKNPEIIAKNLSRLLGVMNRPPVDTPAERAKFPQLFVNYYNEQLKFIPQWNGEKGAAIPHQSSSKLHRLKQRVVPTFVRFQETIKTIKDALTLMNEMNENGETISLQWGKILAIEGINGVRPLTPLTAAGKKYVAEQQEAKKGASSPQANQPSPTAAPATKKKSLLSRAKSKLPSLPSRSSKTPRV